LAMLTLSAWSSFVRRTKAEKARRGLRRAIPAPKGRTRPGEARESQWIEAWNHWVANSLPTHRPSLTQPSCGVAPDTRPSSADECGTCPYRARGLNLVVAAIVLWNTVYLERAVKALRERGDTIPDDLVAHLSPLGWEDINLTGDYVWKPGTGTRRCPLCQLRLPMSPDEPKP
jgi:hypothetical protein